MKNSDFEITDKIVRIPFLKRFFDILLSAILILPILPITLIIFIVYKSEGLIKPASRGPLFYTETRVSQGRPFKFRKFRIFKQAVLDEVLKNDGFIHTKPLENKQDNLTYTGGFLKKFYLDELPQIFSVFWGEMSFVGPRPWNLVDYKDEIERGVYRKKVIKAGITGLVQVSKGFHKNDLLLDNQYIKFCRHNPNWKILLFDFKILGKSIIVLLKGQGL
ncbi:sugar transferase [Patescibacteria group bacterium]|nr:sugar transferase [Patescibacteria group bacterium]